MCPFWSILGTLWESLLAPCSLHLGYLFLCIFGYAKKHAFCSRRVPKWSHFGSHFWHLFRIGQKSIFEDPYIENATFSLPRATQNESKNNAKMGYPKRYPKSEKKCLKTTPLGHPLATKRVPKKPSKKRPQKNTKKKLS